MRVAHGAEQSRTARARARERAMPQSVTNRIGSEGRHLYVLVMLGCGSVFLVNSFGMAATWRATMFNVYKPYAAPPYLSVVVHGSVSAEVSRLVPASAILIDLRLADANDGLKGWPSSKIKKHADG